MTTPERPAASGRIMTDLDGEALTCPGCQQLFIPVGRQKHCCEACRVAVYRRSRATHIPDIAPRSRQPIAVYACDRCGARAVGERRCEECRSAMGRVGLGGHRPCCGEPIAVDELLGQEVIA